MVTMGNNPGWPWTCRVMSSSAKAGLGDTVAFQEYFLAVASNSLAALATCWPASTAWSAPDCSLVMAASERVSKLARVVSTAVFISVVLVVIILVCSVILVSMVFFISVVLLVMVLLCSVIFDCI